MINPSVFKQGETISFNGKIGTIMFFDHKENCSLIKFIDSELKNCTSIELIEAYSNKELSFISQNLEPCLKASSDDLLEIERRNMYVEELDTYEFPASRQARLEVQEKISNKLNGDTKANSISALYRYYKTWKDDNKNMSLQVLRESSDRHLTVNNVELLYSEFYFDVAVIDHPNASISETIREFYQWGIDEGYGQIKKSPPTLRRYHEKLSRLKVIKAVDGKSEARQQGRAAIQKFKGYYPLERVEMDAMHINIGLLDDDRNYLGSVIIYLVIDVGTRSILGYSIEVGKRGENSGAVVHTARFAVAPKKDPHYPMHGFFINVIHDNGTAYTAGQTQDCLRRLSSSVSPTRVKQGEGKPFIERVIGTIRHKFLRKLSSYLHKKDTKKLTDKTLKHTARLTITEFKELFAEYVVHNYHKSPHSQLNNKTPLEAWNEGIVNHPPRVPSNITDMDNLRGIRETHVLQPTKGIQTQKYFFNSTALSKLYHLLHGNKKDHKVIVDILLDPLDASGVSVINPIDGSMLNVPNTAGITAEDDISFAELDAKRKAIDTADQAPLFTEKKVLQKIRKNINKKGKAIMIENDTPENTWDEIMNEGHATVSGTLIQTETNSQDVTNDIDDNDDVEACDVL